MFSIITLFRLIKHAISEWENDTVIPLSTTGATTTTTATAAMNPKSKESLSTQSEAYINFCIANHTVSQHVSKEWFLVLLLFC